MNRWYPLNIKNDLKEIGGTVWIGLIWLRTGEVVRCFEHGHYLLMGRILQSITQLNYLIGGMY
jgi:hypothetical protein